MVGYAFMGAAHSQGWRTAPRFFDLPLKPRMVASCGRDAARCAAAARARLGVDRDRLARAGRARRHRPRRHLHPGRHPCRDRDRRARGRQARAVREAARQHGRGGRGDGGGRRARAARAASGRWSASPTGACRPSPWPGSWWRRAARRDPARPRAVPPGLARRPAAPLTWRLRRTGPARGARRHRRAHHRPHPAHHRRTDRQASPRCIETFVTERPLPPAAAGPVRREAGTGRGPGDVTVDDAARLPRPASAAARSGSSRPPGSPPAARTRSGWRSTVAGAASPSTSRT